MLSDEYYFKKYTGTQKYMAKEVHMREAYHKSADVFSLGCVFLELTHGSQPVCECVVLQCVVLQCAVCREGAVFVSVVVVEKDKKRTPFFCLWLGFSACGKGVLETHRG